MSYILSKKHDGNTMYVRDVFHFEYDDATRLDFTYNKRRARRFGNRNYAQGLAIGNNCMVEKSV